MAQHALVRLDRLAHGLILAPERYDPRRRAPAGAITLGDVAVFVRDLVSPEAPGQLDRCLVLDVGDAREGVLQSGKSLVPQSAIGSTKKRTRPGDVLISRLRPYLRQVAYVDPGLVPADAALLCSTEFFVLRGRDDRSIAFLVAYLLSDPVQQILALSQEGGHHPRFGESALLGLPLPVDIDKVRDAVSIATTAAVTAARQADDELRALAARFAAAISPTINP